MDPRNKTTVNMVLPQWGLTEVIEQLCDYQLLFRLTVKYSETPNCGNMQNVVRHIDKAMTHDTYAIFKIQLSRQQ